VIDESLLPHLVQVDHPAIVTDRYGNETTDWAGATQAHVWAWLQQNTGREDTDQRDAQIGEWLMICNPVDADGAPVTVYGADRVHWGDLLFEVIGPPGPAYEPTALHHYEIRLKSVEG
jgi:head-tail adaptor